MIEEALNMFGLTQNEIDIYRYLLDSKRPSTVKEITERLEISERSVRENIKDLLQKKIIKKEEKRKIYFYRAMPEEDAIEALERNFNNKLKNIKSEIYSHRKKGVKNMSDGKILDTTKSICPVCFKRIEARLREVDGKVIIEKDCEEHGHFEDVFWSDAEMYKRAKRYMVDKTGVQNPNTKELKGCPFDCGLCPNHKSHTVLGLIDVTNRCNLKCPICFANANAAGYVYEPTVDQIKEMLENMKNEMPVGAKAIQYSGGEPLMRDDIVELVKLAKDVGYTHVQIATNGLRLAYEPELAQKLKDAGLNIVYLQFDGLTEKPYIIARGRNLLPEKLKVIEACRKAKLAVTLVPTLVKGMNDDQMGDIIRFAIDNIDIVRSVNIQPVSFTGRISTGELREQRITIPDFEKIVEEQTNGQIKAKDFYPIPCVVSISKLIEVLRGVPQPEFTCHPHCGSATYVFIKDTDDGHEIIPINDFVDVDKFFDLIKKATEIVKKGGTLKKPKLLKMALTELPKVIDRKKAPFDIVGVVTKVLKNPNYNTLSEFHYKGLMIGCMHFQDPYNLREDRVSRCIIHYASPDGRIIPFCSMNTIYREDIEKKFSESIEEWNKKNKTKVVWCI